MTEHDSGKGNLLITYLFEHSADCADLLGNNMCEERMKQDLQKLAEEWKRRGFIKRYMIADDSLISNKLARSEQEIKINVRQGYEDYVTCGCGYNRLMSSIKFCPKCGDEIKWIK